MRAFVIGLVSCITLAASDVTHAATFTVNSTNDGVDANPGDGNCATATGHCTLRAAVQETNALPGADSIVVPAGLFNLTNGGRNEEAAATGDLDITDDLVVDGAGAKSTVITGYGADRVFDVHQPAQLTLTGVTITGGSTPANDYVDEGDHDGGGMKNDGSITLTNVTFRSNRSGGYGGGLSNRGTAILSRVVFSRNAAADTVLDHVNGGALTEAGWGGGLANWGNISLTDVTFTGNRAGNGDSSFDGGSGGGMLNEGSATLTRVTFQSNRAGKAVSDGFNPGYGGSGGGVFNDSYTTATLKDVIFRSNSAGNGGSSRDQAGGGGDGGGLCNHGTVTVTNARFTHNHAGRGGNSPRDSAAGGKGGGMASDEDATLMNVTFDKNNAGDSPGVGGDGGGFAGGGTLTNVTSVFNRAGNGKTQGSYGGWGGGISGGTLTNVTVAFNHAGKGSTPGRGDNLAFIGQAANTIVAGSANNCNFPITSLGHNIDSGTSCGFAAAGDLTNTDPGLASLKDNGGFAPTMALPLTSPAIDAGDNGTCSATDARAVSRPQGAACDIGAFELEQ